MTLTDCADPDQNRGAIDPFDAAGERVRVVSAYDVVGARGDTILDSVAAFLGRLCDAPVTLVTVIDADSQHVLARTGLDADVLPRATSFCQHAIIEEDLIEVRDATLDSRFADNPFVTGDAHVRFYAGVPLRSPEGAAFGTVCVFDMAPRPEGLTAIQREGLTLMATLATNRLNDRRAEVDRRAIEARAAHELAESELRFRTLADTMPQMVWSTRPDGYHDYYNARWYEYTGVPHGSTDGEGWNDMFHAEDRARARDVWRHSLATGDAYSIEYRLKHHAGGYRWVLGRALPIRDDHGAITRWFGTCTDIHEQKLALEEREIISQELSHRIKNIFAVISGLISFAARGRPEFAVVAADLRERITALGRAHDFVRPHSAHSRPSAQQDSLHALLDDLFLPYQRAGDERVRVTGDDLLIDDRSATPIALLFHELATNATKYGALTAERGTVAVEIGTGSDTITLNWRETGGPPVVAPEGKSGFGSQLIELSAVRQLGGTVSRDWRADGLIVSIAIPRASFSRAAG